ncbi:replication factor C large subunit [Candidatus Pacearchaeota archaeon]|nr:replication factor C large subunit [Candidatus Pacearchaeota archaeon]MBD3283383.1 replication factor C large subunit [Candidatus Pacearchaeota archaeon]
MNEKSLPFVEKYRIESTEDIIGQNRAIQEIKLFIKTFPRKKAIILNGPPGTGKTCTAVALAKENKLEIFELNASDLRNRAKLEEVLKPVTLQQPLFKKGKLILMDEADGITGTDRGGLPELIALIEKTKFPIIITANDIWKKKFSLLRKKCNIVNLKNIEFKNSIEIIKKVLEKENQQISAETINLIAEKSRGDVRALLNDLESVISLGEESLKTEISEREKQEEIFISLKKIFQNPPDSKTIRAYDNSNLDLNEIALWIEENIPLEYKGKALYNAIESLSKSDLFKGRIYRQQHWRFLVYQNFFLTAGISTATKLKNKKFTSYKRPSRILKIWLSNQKNAKKKSIIAKYSKLCHMSKKKAMKDNFILPLILDNLDEKVIKKMDLNEKEISYLKDRKAAVIIANNLNKFRLEN